ncbi:hypothetical protein [Phaeobacter sp.]|uniref:hypothetical protein n=1 Tax=Phaeobacter sp. TaxID=1902409 RepID=UPI0025D44458|nr:hypothetical protein [Phaeobacter sp.]
MTSLFACCTAALTSLVMVTALASAASSQAVVPAKPDTLRLIDPGSSSPLRDVPMPEAGERFTPQLATRVVHAPSLSILVREPVEIAAPDLVIVVTEPTEVSTPELVIALREPVEIAAPELIIVVKKPVDLSSPPLLIVVQKDEDPDNEGKPEVDGNGSSSPLGSKTVSGHPICVGEYTIHSTGAASGGIGPDGVAVPDMPVGTPVMAKATLSTDSCGAVLTMKSQGQSIQLVRQDGSDNAYIGELQMPDGVSRTLHLTCESNLNMRGMLHARDGRIKVRRPMWLRPADTTTTTLAACAK